MGEVVALEEDWEGPGFGEGVGGAVAEVEGGDVAAFAVAEEGVAGDVGEGGVYGMIWMAARAMRASRSVQLAASPVWVARTMLVSRRLTAERSVVGADAMAIRAELSITMPGRMAVTWGGRGRRRGRRR